MLKQMIKQMTIAVSGGNRVKRFAYFPNETVFVK